MARRIPGSRSKRAPGASADGAGGDKPDYRPSREDILKFVAENPDRASKRDIAKAFSLRGEDRIWLKAVLRDLQAEGVLEKRSRKLHKPGALPHVTVLDVYGRDEDGGLLARPSEEREGFESEIVAIRPTMPGKGPTPGVGDRVLARIFPADEAQGPDYTGQIIKVFDKRRETALGVIRRLPDGSHRAEPVERRQPEMLVEGEFLNDAQPGDLVELEPMRPTRYGLPRGKVTSIIGSLSSEKAVSMIAIHAHDIPHIFPRDVIEEAEQVTPASMEGREDWRDVPLVTIDPADAKDHDDAVHAVPDEDQKNPGGVIVTVAIADVAAYVRPGSPLDREALKRGNSVYFPDRVVPMLPERISNDLCSLREGQDRPALAVRMTFAADGRKLRHSFHRVMMKSAARLSYPQAQAAVDGAGDDKTGPILEGTLRPLWEAYAVLSRGRQHRGPLELDLPERKLQLKPDGTIDRVVVPERLDAHRLIEEFMIQANVAAAETLEAKKQPLIYRIHDAPSLSKQESLREFLQTVDLSLARGPQLRPSQFNALLEKVKGEENELLINEVVLRSQSQAEYSPGNIGHFGLNLRRYAHFTSPIRRCADLVVHRALIAALGLGKDGLTPGEEARLEDTSALISASERRAMAAERDTVDRLIADHLASRKGEEFEARVGGVTKAGLFVRLPQFGADGFIPVSSLGNDYYIYDESAHSLVGERGGKGYRLGDAVEVRLVEIAPLAGSMRFEMLSEPRPLPPATRSFHKAKRRDRRLSSKAPRRAGVRQRRK